MLLAILGVQMVGQEKRCEIEWEPRHRAYVIRPDLDLATKYPSARENYDKDRDDICLFRERENSWSKWDGVEFHGKTHVEMCGFG